MIVLIDIDHVICDSSRRDWMIGTSSWDEYHEAAKDDRPVGPIIHLVNALSRDGHTVIGFTVRPEKFRLMTNRWMLKNGVMLMEILMREDNDYRPSYQIKTELTQNVKADLVIDDRKDVCKAFNARGITTFEVLIGHDSHDI